jgi:hypothetical protein
VARGPQPGVAILPGVTLADVRARLLSEAGTGTDARLFDYDVELHDVDDPSFHLRWGGRHAAALLATLQFAFRRGAPVRQVEWGSYEAVLDGAATRRLLGFVLDEETWRDEPVEVVPHDGGDDPQPEVIDLGRAVRLLADDRYYSVLADFY